MRAAFVSVILCSLLCATAHADPVRLMVSIGDRLGDADDVPLQFADEDARRVQALFTEIGDVAPENAFLLQNQTASEVLSALAQVRHRADTLSRSGADVVLMVFVSSHAQAGILHLRGTHLPLVQLRELLSQIHARLRIALVDACDSGIIARDKGGKKGPDYQVSVEQLTLKGQVLISSSGPAEPAQEWTSLGGSLFTHYWITGLRGDADENRDGRVSLMEAYTYAYRHTVADAAVAPQHPTFDFDVAGSGDLTLTTPGVSGSAVVFPEGLAGNYVVTSQPRPDVIAEVQKQAGKRVRLAVPAGHYLVRKRLGAQVGMLQLDLPYGGEALVEDTSMTRESFVDVAMKGDEVELHPSALFLMGTLERSPLQGTGLRWRGGLGYRLDISNGWLLFHAAVGETRFRGVDLTVTEDSLTAAAEGGYRWPLPSITLELGLAAEAVGLRQTLVRDRETEIRPAWGAAPPIQTLGASFGPVFGVEVPLVWRLLLLAHVEGVTRYLPAENQTYWSFDVQGEAGIGLRL